MDEGPRRAIVERMTDAYERQAARAVLMIRPRNFGNNPETSASNPFQLGLSLDPQTIATRACEECDALALALVAAGVRVHLYEDVADPPMPDAVFPNNWLSTHADGTVVIYPMLAPSRRIERRHEIIRALVTEGGYAQSELIDLTSHEGDEHFLEGTGSLVLDRVHRIAYATRSSRTDPEPLADFGRRMGYRLIEFDALDATGRPFYHTNVMLSIGTNFAVCCVESLVADADRERLVRTLEATGRELIEISQDQVSSHVGNLLELQSVDGKSLIAMSNRARGALTSLQLAALSKHGRLVCTSLDTVEDAGGGSARCMLCEVHLPSSVPL